MAPACGLNTGIQIKYDSPRPTDYGVVMSLAESAQAMIHSRAKNCTHKFFDLE